MFRTRTRSVMTFAVVLEGGIAGWAVGAGWLGLLVMVAAVTLMDTAWGIARRGVVADIAGLEVALALALMLAVGAPGVPVALTAGACAAWLVRDGRDSPAPRPSELVRLRED
jgi:ABC-type sulfate transport system permease subunit